MKAPEKLNPTKWSMPDAEWMRDQHLVQGKPLIQIAEELGSCKKTVQGWAKKLNIYDGLEHPVLVGSGSGARFYGVTKEWLVREYFEKGKSAHQIGQEIGSSWNAIIVWLRKYGLEPRDWEEICERHSDRMSGDKNPSWIDGSSRHYHFNLLKKSGREYRCEWCGHDQHLQVHHRNHDTSDGDLSNLAWLCGLCNRMEAQLWGLREKGRAEFWINSEGNLEVSFS